MAFIILIIKLNYFKTGSLRLNTILSTFSAYILRHRFFFKYLWLNLRIFFLNDFVDTSCLMAHCSNYETRNKYLFFYMFLLCFNSNFCYCDRRIQQSKYHQNLSSYFRVMGVTNNLLRFTVNLFNWFSYLLMKGHLESRTSVRF